jgi:hypothetical protein
MNRLGFRIPLLQVEIRDARGLVAFTDFDWPDDQLCGEFDGLVKYRNAEYPGAGHQPRPSPTRNAGRTGSGPRAGA